MKIITMVTLIGCLLLPVPLAAQEMPCTPNLTPVRELLDQADISLSEGASEDALALMQSASEQLQSLIDACTTKRLVARNGQLTLNYPENWLYELADGAADAPKETSVYFATTAALFDSDTPVSVLNPGEQQVSLYFGEPGAIFVGLDFAPSAPGLLTAYQEFVLQSPYEYDFGEIEAIRIHDYPAATLDFNAPTFAARAYALELESEAAYVLIVAMSAPGELQILAPVVLEMAASVRYDPAAAAAKIYGGNKP